MQPCVSTSQLQLSCACVRLWCQALLWSVPFVHSLCHRTASSTTAAAQLREPTTVYAHA